MTQRLFKSSILICFTLTLGNLAHAETAKTNPAEAPRDVFAKSGVTVDFDCGNGKQQSPYCLIHLMDTKSGVACYGLVSTDKVVNPSINCVAINAKK